MSATVDLNVLLYSSDSGSPYRPRARDLIERLGTGSELVYLFWPVLMGYLRVSTHPSIFSDPLPVDRAVANVETLVRRPQVRTPGEGEGFWRLYGQVTSSLVVGANLVTDAHIVALMKENGVDTIWTHDRDFRKFDGITIRDPFA